MFNPNHVYLRPIMEILPPPIQMQLSGKKKKKDDLLRFYFIFGIYIKFVAPKVVAT